MGLRMIRAGGVQLLLVAALSSHATAQDPPHLSAGRATSFELVSGFEVVVHGQIGELGDLKFILDTGSSYSVIDLRLAERMGLHRRPGNVLNFDRNLALEWAEVSDVRVGPICIPAMDMMVTRVADISEFAENVDGIIGMDVLSRAQKMSIDYDTKRISFEMDERRGSKPFVMRTFVIPVVIQGISMRLLVDTGLKYIVLYKERLRSTIPHLRIEGEPRDGLMGRLQVTQVKLPGVRILGSEAVTPVLLLGGPFKTDNGAVDGYLGPASLHVRLLELDFVARTLRWR